MSERAAALEIRFLSGIGLAEFALVIIRYFTFLVAFFIFFGPPPTQGNEKALQPFTEGSLACYWHFNEAVKPTTYQTVFNVAVEDGRIVLHKRKGDGWFSYKRLGSGYTIQGDATSAIFIFGPELATELGFLYRIDDSHVEIHAPGAQLFSSKILKMNEKLKNQGQEPISYLLVDANFLEEEEFLSLASDNLDIELVVPYAQQDRITPHEVAYHLTGIIFPRKFLNRAARINRHTVSFAKFLNNVNSDFKMQALKIAKQLMFDRAYEVDTGVADIPASLAELRKGLISYDRIWHDIKYSRDKHFLNHFKERLNLLARPHLRPIEALMARLHYMTGVQIPFTTDFFTEPDLQFGINGKIELNESEKTTLAKLMHEYQQLHASDDLGIELSTAGQWLEDFMINLDDRIEQLKNAALSR